MGRGAGTQALQVPAGALHRRPAGSAAGELYRHKDLCKIKLTELLGQGGLRWTRAKTPTLASLEPFRHLFQVAHQEAILTNLKGATVVEQAKGGRLVLGYDGGLPTAEEMASFFVTQGLPASLNEDTRDDYDSLWRGWVTFGLMMEKEDLVFPADKHLLMSFMTHMILCQYAAPTIGNFLSCIVTRHTYFGHRSPFMWGEMTRWLKGLRKNTSAGTKTKFRLRPLHLRIIAALPVKDLSAERDICMILLGTVGACRQSEVTKLDVCDWIGPHSPMNRERDAVGCAYGALVYVKRQKNDPEGQGAFKRFAFGERMCLVRRMEKYMELAGLRVQPGCLKWKDPSQRGAPCVTCGRLFPAMPGGNRVRGNGQEGVTKHTLGKALTRVLRATDIDDTGFTSKSMRKGGLSTAKRAGIPAALRKRQSNHKSGAHKIYESATDTDEEGMPDIPRTEPLHGYRTEHLYRFSKSFSL